MRTHLGLWVLFSLILTWQCQTADAYLKPDAVQRAKARLIELQNTDEFKSVQKLLPKGALRDDIPNEPEPSINKPLTPDEINDLDSGVFISQFIAYILTGRFDGNTTYGDAFDNNTLDAILSIGIQIYISVIAEDPPDNAYGLSEPDLYDHGMQ